MSSVAAAVLIALIFATARFLFQLRDLVRRESSPNGGSSTKDYMARTTRVLEAIQQEQRELRVEAARQTEIMEGVRRDLQEHNELTGRMVGALIEGGRR